MIDQIELKNMHSKELRTLRNMIREELDFRADVGSEIDNKNAWVSANEPTSLAWRVQGMKEWGKKERKEKESATKYIDETNMCRIS